jgi:ribosomal protein S18 acetylase RimI-like enzyme
MEKVELRGWKREDLDQIADLWIELATFVNPMDGFYEISPDARRKYRGYLDRVFGDRSYAGFVAHTNEGLIGFAMGRINKNASVVTPGTVGYIENVFVREEKREAGVGTALCNRLFDWFRKKRIGHVELFYQIENRSASAFWKKMGFRTWLAKAYKVI